ncbi:MAG: radical SAM protein [Candidatus Omnitrophica bacterium]|nr:radical SAM protein [Candidatus Omnitrophota bacterium]
MSADDRPHVLLVNPWIYDFAAYDLWMFPLGLLHLARRLESVSRMSMLNLLARDTAVPRRKADRSITAAYGTGFFIKEPMAKPWCAGKYPERIFFRYGLPPRFAERRLPRRCPDIILVTSGMTYWYRGVAETIAWLRRFYPKTPLVLGGIYATLCAEHARRHSGADEVVAGGAAASLSGLARRYLGIELPMPDAWVFPQVELLSVRSAVPLRLSEGCPFRCSYCASRQLAGEFRQCAPERAVEFVRACIERHGTRDFIFYDDALLYRAERLIKPFLTALAESHLPARFHTPNGMHARYLDAELAGLMRRAGFMTIRLSFDSAGDFFAQRSDGKVGREHLKAALGYLTEAGFTKRQVGVYTLIGFPGQTPAMIREDMRFIRSLGARIELSSYALVPGTGEWKDSLAAGLLSEETDLLELGHTLFPVAHAGFPADMLRGLRREAAAWNRAP